MKKYILIILTSLGFVSAKAQSSYNYATYGLGVSVSSTRAFADLKTQYNNYAYSLNLNYYTSPFMPVTLEIQAGKLSGGGLDISVDKDTRKFENSYKAIILRMDVQLGEIINYENSTILNIVKNFYGGAGFGMMINNVKVNRYSLIDPTYRFPGTDQNSGLMVPLRFGYEFKFYNEYDEPNVRLDVGYQHNFTFNEGLDGYTDPSTKFKNNALDQYRQIYVGVKVNFGGLNTHYRPIRGRY